MYVLGLQRTFMIAHYTKKYDNAVANMCVVVPLLCQTLSHLVIFRSVFFRLLLSAMQQNIN